MTTTTLRTKALARLAELLDQVESEAEAIRAATGDATHVESIKRAIAEARDQLKLEG